MSKTRTEKSTIVATSPVVHEPCVLPYRLEMRDLGDQYVVHTEVFEHGKESWHHHGDCFGSRSASRSIRATSPADTRILMSPSGIDLCERLPIRLDQFSVSRPNAGRQMTNAGRRIRNYKCHNERGDPRFPAAQYWMATSAARSGLWRQSSKSPESVLEAIARISLRRFPSRLGFGGLAGLLRQGLGRMGITGAVRSGDQLRIGVGRVERDEQRRDLGRAGPVAGAEQCLVVLRPVDTHLALHERAEARLLWTQARLSFVERDPLADFRPGVAPDNDFLVAFGLEELIERLMQEVLTDRGGLGLVRFDPVEQGQGLLRLSQFRVQRRETHRSLEVGLPSLNVLACGVAPLA